MNKVVTKKGDLRMNPTDQITFLKQLAKALAVQFGPKCEVAVHDLTNDPENTIVAIENGGVTGRRVGNGASQIVLEALKSDCDVEDQYGYLIRTRDGRLLKSSSIYMRDNKGHPVALLSINFDVTELSHSISILEQLVNPGQDKQEDNDVNGVFSNVNDLLDKLVEESLAYVGKPVALMNKDDKIKAIKYLDSKGAFLIKKSGDKVTKVYDISKYTLYNYLDTEPEQ